MVDVVRGIEQDGVIAVVRLDDLSDAINVAEALIAGGIRAVEFTYSNPAAGEAITATRAAVGARGMIGAGSVLDPETARAAILAGAEFLVTPTLNVATITMGNRYGVPVLSGALTPTEILTAWEAGAAMVKVFPATLGGPKYVRDVLAPLPQLKLVPTGGVSVDNAADFIKAGAVALGVGSALVDQTIVDNKSWEELTERARRLGEAVAAAREGYGSARSLSS
jgi:2-dehydro-3-deoxyphosphogluconate aldolase/(4S)-4-hydroxy-2-oxoglutarate aldolase